MCKRLALAAMLVMALVTARLSAADEFSLGNPAPRLEVQEFVKGEPVKEFEKGKVYVVEFWATWCGPCKISIPHLTALQKKHKDVVFIGVSVWEDKPADVKPYVDKMGEKMNYRVALDAIPAARKPDQGKMAKGWLDAAHQEGIPTAFVVDGEGRVAWVGHPDELEKPLTQIIAGTWDLKAADARFKEEQLIARKMSELRIKLERAEQKKDTKAMLALIDEAIKSEPKLEKEVGVTKFMLLLAAPDGGPKAAEYGKKLAETVLKDDAEGQNALAWAVVEPGRPKADAAALQVALAAARRSNELDKDNPAALDTLARVYFMSGEVTKAIETQERALKLGKGTPLEKEIADRLEEYRKAKK